jgi:hypothetical protein
MAAGVRFETTGNTIYQGFTDETDPKQTRKRFSHYEEKDLNFS